jgi:predicted ArsR family transcriptional regulator
MTQQLLIDFTLPVRERARGMDPQTSADAAARVDEFGHKHFAVILRALAVGPQTIYEIAARTDLSHIAVARRLPELERLGRAQPTDETRLGSSGRMCRVWERTA